MKKGNRLGQITTRLICFFFFIIFRKGKGRISSLMDGLEKMTKLEFSNNIGIRDDSPKKKK